MLVPHHNQFCAYSKFEPSVTNPYHFVVWLFQERKLRNCQHVCRRENLLSPFTLSSEKKITSAKLDKINPFYTDQEKTFSLRCKFI